MSVRYSKGKIVEGSACPSYEIDSVLSVGMFAVSYLAYSKEGRKVFLKQYKSPSCRVKWYQGYMQWQQELKRRITGNVELSERTYGFIDFFEFERAFIQVFEFIDGGKDLRTYLDEGTMTTAERFAFASLLLYSLCLFHDAGIIHTDLKPENVYLVPMDSQRWGLKLIDFDFTMMEGWCAPWHGSMNYCGTPRYMSPEHVTGKIPGKYSDVFTAAIIIYELLAGGHPFPADDNKYADAIINGRCPHPIFPSRIGSLEMPQSIKDFGDILFKALSPNPEERPNMRQLHSALLSARNDFLLLDYDNWSKPQYEIPNADDAVPTAISSSGNIKLRTVPQESHLSSWRCGGCGYSGISSDIRKCPACGTLRYPEIVLSGKSGAVRVKLPTIFGAGNLIEIVGEEDAKFANTDQFKIYRDSDNGIWYVVAARRDITNPPVHNGSILDEKRRPLANGDVIYVVSSRKDPGKKRGLVNVKLP